MTTEEKFHAAVNVIKGLPKDGPYQPSQEMKLLFYGLYKQATEGPCTEPKPSFYQVVAGYKWRAWNAIGDITKTEAMERYVSELKKIVETMSYSADVATFMEVLGSFYEYVDMVGNNNELAAMKPPAGSDSYRDTNSTGGGDPASNTSEDAEGEEDLSEQEAVSRSSQLALEASTATAVEEEVVESEGQYLQEESHLLAKPESPAAAEGATSLPRGPTDLNGGLPYRNCHLSNGDLKANGIVGKSYFITPPATPTDRDYRQQQQHQQQLQQQQWLADSEAEAASSQCLASLRARLPSDSDTEDEYSEPSESLAFCSGSSGGYGSPLSSHYQSAGGSLNKGDANFTAAHHNSLGYLPDHTEGSYNSITPPQRSSISSTQATSNNSSTRSNTTTLAAVASNNQAITSTQLLTSIASVSNTSSSTALNLTPQGLSGSQHQQNGGGAGGGDDMVVVLRQMQGDLQAMTHCLQAHLNDISQCLVALHRTSIALQSRGGGGGSSGGVGGGHDSGGASEVQQRRQRQWWPFPELSPRSTFWLLLWPVALHLALKMFKVAVALRQRQRK